MPPRPGAVAGATMVSEGLIRVIYGTIRSSGRGLILYKLK